MGQPSDASPRLIGALATADIVAAEDTRRLRTLANALDVTIGGKVVSFFDHVEAARVPALVEQINAGATVLVVSDAGMPLISDPGHRLVAACVAAGIVVQCLPGPSAVTTALAVSGLPSERFCFEGFAPRKQAARRSWLASLAAEQRTAVFFESPRRLHTCLLDAVDQLGGDRRAAVCRELTKVHEEGGPRIAGRASRLVCRPALGEITVVSSGAVLRADLPTLVSQVMALVDAGMRVKDAGAQVIAATPVRCVTTRALRRGAAARQIAPSGARSRAIGARAAERRLPR